MIESSEIKVGTHLLINITKVDDKIINDNNKLMEIMNLIVDSANLTVLNKHFHFFEPHGFTGLYLLSESHLSLHTWPEHKKICMDIFTCGETNLEGVISYLTNTFPYIKINTLER